MRPAVELRPFGRADFDELIGWVPDARLLLQWAGPAYTFPLTAAQLEANQRQAETDPPGRFLFRAVARRAGQSVGHVEIALPSDRPGCGRLARIMAAPAQRGRGLGLRIVQLACAHAFGHLGLRELSLYVFDFNHPAIACYERAGFAPTGAVKSCPFEGETWRGLEMALPRERWPGR